MTPDIQKTLAELAQKMGTTVERLWPMLVAKARLEAGIEVFGGFALVALLAWVTKRCYQNVKTIDEGESTWLISVFGLLISAVAIVGVLCGATSSIPDLVYPEVSAIHHILGH